MCRLMDRVILNELRESVFVFIDDLLVFSKNFESRMFSEEIALSNAGNLVDIKCEEFVSGDYEDQSSLRQKQITGF